MEIQTYERVVEERHAITVDEIDLGNDRFLFRYNEEITRTGAKPKTVKKEGIATARQLKDLRAGREAKFERYNVFSDNVLAEVIRMGYAGITKDNFRAVDKNTDSPFEHVANGGSLDNVVRFEGYDHSFWRADGTLLPTGIMFEYISAAIHDGCYDLPKLVEILRKRDDVTIWARRETARYGDQPDSAAPGEEIDDIPYYNRERDQTKTVTFFWTPTQELAERLRGPTDRFKVVFDEDLLGLRAGGAAKFGDFYERGYVYEEEDDD
jgi:hypothetical protein